MIREVVFSRNSWSPVQTLVPDRNPQVGTKPALFRKNACSVTSAKMCLYLVVSCPRCHTFKKKRKSWFLLWPKTRCAWSWNILWHGRKGLSNKRSVGWAGQKGRRKHTRHVSFVKITEFTFMFVTMKNGCWLVCHSVACDMSESILGKDKMQQWDLFNEEINGVERGRQHFDFSPLLVECRNFLHVSLISQVWKWETWWFVLSHANKRIVCQQKCLFPA